MLFNEEYPDANIYAQSLEIKDSIPYAIEEAAKLGYTIDHMAMSGGSAGGCLTLLYACRGTTDLTRTKKEPPSYDARQPLFHQIFKKSFR